MTRLFAIAALLAVLAGCGDRTPPAAKPAEPATPASADAPKDGSGSLMRGKTSLYLYDTDPGSGAPGKPRMEIRDANVTVEQRDGKDVWTFHDAHAILYGDDGAETHLQAGDGWLDETSNRANLSGGVRMEMGSKSIDLVDVELWAEKPADSTDPNAKAVWRARSDKPITLRDGESEVAAASLDYDVNTKGLTLKNLEGTLHFVQAAAPDAAPAEAAAESQPPAETGAGQQQGSANP